LYISNPDKPATKAVVIIAGMILEKKLGLRVLRVLGELGGDVEGLHQQSTYIEVDQGVQGSGFRVQGSGFRVQGSGFRVEERVGVLGR
jgi:hypothetical protein